MGSAEKHSWLGGGQGLFPCIGSMIKGQPYFRRLTSTYLGSMLTNSPRQEHAHHAEGVQYEIKSNTKAEPLSQAASWCLGRTMLCSGVLRCLFSGPLGEVYKQKGSSRLRSTFQITLPVHVACLKIT